MTMTTNDVTQAQRLHGYHTRRPRTLNPTTANPRRALPPVEALGPDAPADLVATLTQWHDLASTVRDHQRKQTAALAAADKAAEDYRRAIKDAVIKGEDTAKVKDSTARHKATAAAHAEYATTALNAQTRLGVTLGQLFEQHASDLYAGADTILDETAREVRGTLDLLHSSWARWSTAFAHRRWLSSVALDGGDMANYHGASPLPAEVAKALDAIADHLREPDRLRSDEQQVTEWRAANG